MAFRGGITLSRVYGVIDRLSEDVDMTLDCRDFAEGFDPLAPDVSRSAFRRFDDRPKSRVENHTRDVGPALEASADGVQAPGRPVVRIDEGGERVGFAYPFDVESPLGDPASELLLEFDCRNVVDPDERHEIVPDIATMTDGLDDPRAAASVLSPARTFWERAFSIHVERQSPAPARRQPGTALPHQVRSRLPRPARHRPHGARRLRLLEDVCMQLADGRER